MSKLSGLSDVTIAYIAGLFDGEGSVGIYELNHPKRIEFTYIATVTNTDKKILDFLKATLGGHVVLEKRQGKSRDCYKWYAKGELAVDFFHTIHSFTITKKPQIEIAMYWSTLNKPNGRAYTSAELNERRLLVTILKQEKRR